MWCEWKGRGVIVAVLRLSSVRVRAVWVMDVV